jgi:hypothetical protein
MAVSIHPVMLPAVRRPVPDFGHDGGNAGAVNRLDHDPEKDAGFPKRNKTLERDDDVLRVLEKSPDQRDIGRAGHQQPDGERQLDAPGEGMEGGSHGRKHPAILAEESQGFFFRGFTSR